MITEDYVSPKVAVLLKSVGFSEPCRTFYTIDPDGKFRLNESDGWTNHNNDKFAVKRVSAPTVQMVVKWLEVEKRMEIEVYRDDTRDEPYTFRIIDNDGNTLDNYGWCSGTKSEAYERAIIDACTDVEASKPCFGWTSVSEAERLSELGLDVMSSDMYQYQIDKHTYELCEGNIEIVVKPYVKNEDWKRYIPCWSVGKLIRCMPNTITDKSLSPVTYRLWIDNESCGYYPVKNGCEKSDNPIVSFSIGICDNPVVETATWLLENGYKLENLR